MKIFQSIIIKGILNYITAPPTYAAHHMNKQFIPVFLLLLLPTAVLAQDTPTDCVTVTFEIQVPESTPDGDIIFWAGSLNNWDPGHEGFGFGNKEYAEPANFSGGRWTISLTAPKGSLEKYKYTRGSVYSAEEQADYTYRPVREVVFDEPKTIRDTVAAWHDLPPKSLKEQWPLVDLQETQIKLFYGEIEMEGTGTIVYDKATGSKFYDLTNEAVKVKDVPGTFYDAVYYYQKLSPGTDDLLLIAAAKMRPEGPWHTFVDSDGDKTIEQAERIYKITDNSQDQSWTGPVFNKATGGSVNFTLSHAPDLPKGYTSSTNTDAPDFTYSLPFKQKEGTINGITFYVSTEQHYYFTDYHQFLIDKNQNDTLEISSGSNEVYSIDLNQMRMEQKFFLYPSFELGEQSWQIASIDPKGEWVRLRPSKATDAGSTPIAKGKRAPEWESTTVSGSNLSSENLQGKYVLLDFWGSWCGPCIEELPTLKSAYHNFKGNNFEIIGFAYESKASLKQALKEYRLPWPQVLDDKGKFSSLFKVRGYPTQYLISPDGTILEMGKALRGERLHTTLKRYLE